MQKLIIGAALAAAFVAPAGALTFSCGENGCSSSTGSFSGLFGGDPFWDKSAGGWDPQVLPRVTVIGSRWNWEDFVMWDYYNSNQLSPPIAFDSRDRGIGFRDEKKQAPPSNKNQKQCLDDCKDTYDKETADCEMKASVVEFGAVVTAGMVWGRFRWAKRAIDPIIEATGLTGKSALVDGTAVAGGYYMICKGWVATRYNNCRDATCKP